MTRFWTCVKSLGVAAAALACTGAFAVVLDVEKLTPVGDTPVANLRLQPSATEAGRPLNVWVVLSIQSIFQEGGPYTQHFLLQPDNSAPMIRSPDADLPGLLAGKPPTLSSSAFPSSGLSQKIMGPTLGEFATEISDMNMLKARYSVFTKSSDSGSSVFGPAVVEFFNGTRTMAEFLSESTPSLTPFLGGASSGQPDTGGPGTPNAPALTGIRLSASSITAGTQERVQIIPTPAGASLQSCYSFSRFLNVTNGVISLGYVEHGYLGSDGFMDAIVCDDQQADLLIKPAATNSGPGGGGTGSPGGPALTGLRLSSSSITVGTAERVQIIPTPVGADLRDCYSHSGFLEIEDGTISLGPNLDLSYLTSEGYRDAIVCGLQQVELLIKPAAGASAGDLVTNVALSRATGGDGITTLAMTITAQGGVKGLLAIGALNVNTGKWLLHDGTQWLDFYPGYSSPPIYNPSLSFEAQPTYTATIRYGSGAAMSGITIVAIIVRPDGRVDDLGVLEAFP